MQTLLSIVETSLHPNFSALYESMDIEESRTNSMRKAIAMIKKHPPDFIVCEFIYGYGNNYAGINISNLDVMLHSLKLYTTTTRVIILVEKTERQYVNKLDEIFPLHAVLAQPVSEAAMTKALALPAD